MNAPGRVITRRQWGAATFPRRHVTVTNDDLAGTEGHHSVTPASWSAERHAINIQDNHLGRGWNGPYYSWGIHESGDVIELRGWRRSQGASQYRGDDYFAPIVFLMDARSDTLTAGHKAGWRFLRSIVLLSDPTATAIGWHNQRDATYCPGPVADWLQTAEAHTLWPDPERDPNMSNWYDDLPTRVPEGIISDPNNWRPEDAATRAEALAFAQRIGEHYAVEAAGLVDAAVSAVVDAAVETAVEAALAKMADVIDARVAAGTAAALKPAVIREAVTGMKVNIGQTATIDK